MLTLEDCIAMSGLTEAEIDAIAEHEHLPDTIALELGCYLCSCPAGSQTIRAIIRDDIAAATARRDFRHSAKLRLVLQRFIAEHAADSDAVQPASS